MTSPAVELQFKGKDSDLSATYDRVSSKTRRMTDDVESSTNRIADSSERSTGRTKAAFGAMATGVAGFIGGMVASSGTDLLSMGKNLAALDVKAKTVFQDQLPRIQKWAEANRKAFGESSRNVVAMAANMTDLLKPMGFTAAQATDMSMKLLDLSGALSRWSGGTRTAAEVSEILSDALLGETDSLKSLGISISAADIQARLAAKGQDKLTGAALQQATALATQELILEKSTDAQKAWAEGGKAAAEAQNAAASNAKESFEKLAIAIQPAIEWLTKFITTIMDWAANHQTAVIAIAAVTAGIWLLNMAMNANPIVLIITAIAALVGALIWLWNNVEGFRNFFIVAWQMITTGVGKAVDVIKGVWSGLMGAIDWVKGGFSRLIDFFIGFKNTVSGIFTGIGNAITGAFKGAVNFLIGLLNGAITGINFLIKGYNAIPFAPDIPLIPKIPKMHDGGIVPGATGEEVLTVLQAGEIVTPRSKAGASAAGGGVHVTMSITGSGGLSELVQKAIRTGDIQLVDQDGNRILVA